MFTRLFAFLSRWLESALTSWHLYEPAQYYPYGVPFRPRFRPNGTHGSTRRRAHNRHQASSN
jgi:hypothetical protein